MFKHKGTIKQLEMHPVFWGIQEQDATLYGIDWNAPLGTDDDQAEAVDVPPIHNQLIASDYSELCALMDPTAYSESHGLDQYRYTVEFVEDSVTVLAYVQ